MCHFVMQNFSPQIEACGFDSRRNDVGSQKHARQEAKVAPHSSMRPWQERSRSGGIGSLLPALCATERRLLQLEMSGISKGFQAYAPVRCDSQVGDAAVEATHAQPALGGKLKRTEHEVSDHVHVADHDLILVLWAWGTSSHA